MQYLLEHKEAKPEYRYLVRDLFACDYYLYNDLDEAYLLAENMATLANSPHAIYGRVMDSNGQWRTCKIATCFGAGQDNDDDGDWELGLHYKYYTDAGQWLNPPNEE